MCNALIFPKEPFIFYFIFFSFLLKGLSVIVHVIVHFKLHFFPNPQMLLHIQRQFHCNNLPMQQNSIFLERETILCCWELIITGDD